MQWCLLDGKQCSGHMQPAACSCVPQAQAQATMQPGKQREQGQELTRKRESCLGVVTRGGGVSGDPTER